jgi:hypothetical protein
MAEKCELGTLSTGLIANVRPSCFIGTVALVSDQIHFIEVYATEIEMSCEKLIFFFPLYF